MQTEVVVALIVSGLALLSAAFTAILSARKTDLDILRGIIEELRKTIEGLEKKVSELECENKDLKDWAARLVDQVKDAGLKPVQFIRRIVKGDHAE